MSKIHPPQMMLRMQVTESQMRVWRRAANRRRVSFKTLVTESLDKSAAEVGVRAESNGESK